MPHKRYLAWIIAAGLLAANSWSAAETITFGAGPGKQCYDATLFGDARQQTIALCSTAIDSGTLNGRDLAASYVNRGIIRMRMGDQLGAIADYDKAIEIMPDLGEAHINRGAALIFLERYDEALDAIDTGIAYGTRMAHHAYFNRSIVHENLGNAEAAYADALKARDESPAWIVAQLRVERLARRLGENPGA